MQNQQMQNIQTSAILNSLQMNNNILNLINQKQSMNFNDTLNHLHSMNDSNNSNINNIDNNFNQFPFSGFFNNNINSNNNIQNFSLNNISNNLFSQNLNPLIAQFNLGHFNNINPPINNFLNLNQNISKIKG